MPSWPKDLKEILPGEYFCPIYRILFQKPVLPVALELHKWGGVEGLKDMSGVRWNGHHMYIVFSHLFKKCKVVHMTLV